MLFFTTLRKLRSELIGLDNFSKIFNSEKLIVIIFYLLFVCIHIFLGIRMQQPHIFADELGYLGNARYFAGGSMPNILSHSYHFGYSLFIVWPFLVTNNPFLIYKLVIITNSFLLSALFLISFFISKKIFNKNINESLAISFITCLYPPYLMQSNFAWSESAIIPLFALLLLASYSYINKPSIVNAIFLGVLTSFLYTVHPRTILLLPTIILLFLFFFIKKDSSLEVLISGLFSMFVVFLITVYINSKLTYAAHSHYYTFHLKIFNLGFLKNFLAVSVGQLFYLAASTYGLFLLGIYLIIFRFRDGKLIENQKLFYLFVLISSLAVFVTSVSFMASNPTRGDHYIYGRYNEIFLSVYLLLVLSLEDYDLINRSITLSILTVCVISLLVILITPCLKNTHIFALNTFGIWPYIVFFHKVLRLKLHVVFASIGYICIMLLLTYKTFRNYMNINILASVLFVCTAIFDYSCYVLPPQKNINQKTLIASVIQSLYPTTSCVSYDMAFYKEISPIRFFSYQWLLPNISFKLFNSRLNQEPQCDLVISGREWKGASRAQFIFEEGYADQVLWALGNKKVLFPISYFTNKNVILEKIPGILLEGFYSIEKKRWRWTNGKGRIILPTTSVPSKLIVYIIDSGPLNTSLSIIINGVQVWSGKVKKYSKLVLNLDRYTIPISNKLFIEFNSDFFIPSKLNVNSKDNRRLGICFSKIELSD